MSDMQPVEVQPHVAGLAEAHLVPAAAKPPSQVSRIPQRYAEEVMRRRYEHGWSLRDLSKWLTATVGENISYGSVCRFIQSQERKAALANLQPFYERMMTKADRASDELDIKNAMLDETANELRLPNRTEEEREELKEEHTRLRHEIRGLVTQFNAYSRHIPRPPKADSPAVRGCTGDLTAFTETTPVAESDGAAPVAEAAPANDDLPAVRGCTGDPAGFTESEEAAPAPCLPRIMVFQNEGRTLSFDQWIAAQPEGQSLEIDPGWRSDQSQVFIFDLSTGGEPLDVSLRILDTRPDFEPCMVFVLPQNADRDLFRALPSHLNPPVRLPLTKEKVTALLESVARAKKEFKAPKRRAG